MNRTLSFWGIFVLLLCAIPGFSQQKGTGNGIPDARIIEGLKSFYSFYIKENNGIADRKKVNDSLKKYCTPAFIKKMKAKDLDYDLITHSQDVDMDWIRTMEIKKAGNNIYAVCFLDNYTKKPFCLKVFIAITNAHWQINNVTENK